MILNRLSHIAHILMEFARSVTDGNLAKEHKVLHFASSNFELQVEHLCRALREIDDRLHEKDVDWIRNRRGKSPYSVRVNFKTPKPTRVLEVLFDLLRKHDPDNGEAFLELAKTDHDFYQLMLIKHQCELVRSLSKTAMSVTQIKAVEKEVEYPSASFDDRKYDLKRLDWDEESRKFKRRLNLKKYGVRKPSYKDHGRKNGLRAKEALAAWN